MNIVTVRNRSGREIRMQKRYADILVKAGSHVLVPDEVPQSTLTPIATGLSAPPPEAPKKKRGYKRRDMRAEESE